MASLTCGLAHESMLLRSFARQSVRHLSEQYFTSSHTFFHFILLGNGLPQVAQSLLGRSDFSAA